MKPEKIGLPGSVAIVGLIYAVALAAAPDTAPAAQIDRTALSESKTALVAAGAPASPLDRTGAIETGESIAHPGSSQAIRACPHAVGAKMSFANFMQAHHQLPTRPSETPGASSPAWGKARLTVF